MAELEGAALDAGLRRAVLSATTESQLLYEQLGWHPGALLTAMYLRHVTKLRPRLSRAMTSMRKLSRALCARVETPLAGRENFSTDIAQVF